MDTPDKILLVRPDRLGDLVLSLPVAETLKRYFPETSVCYLASLYAARISPMVDYVDDWLIDDRGDGRRLSLSDLKERMELYNFDCVIDLKPSWRTAAAGFFAGIGKRIGTSRRAYSIFYNERVSIHRRASGFHQTDLELAHLRPLDIDEKGLVPRLRATESGKRAAEELLKMGGHPYIVIHPLSGGSSPNWPFENYRQLAEQIISRTSFKVAITNRDEGIEGFDGCLNIGGKTDMETLAGILESARLFVSGSTGPLHLADALGTKCVSFFTDRDDVGPARWGPRRNMEGILQPEEKCRCRGADNCRCLGTIPVDKAFNKIESVLKSKEDVTFEKR